MLPQLQHNLLIVWYSDLFSAAPSLILLSCLSNAIKLWRSTRHAYIIAVLSTPSACVLIIATCPCTVLRLYRLLKLGILWLNGGNCLGLLLEPSRYVGHKYSENFWLKLIPQCHLRVQPKCEYNFAFHVVMSTTPSKLPRKL